MNKFYYLITEGMKNVWRHKMTAFTAIISLFISLFIVGLLATAGNNTHKVLQYLRSKYKIEVFFKQDVSNEEAAMSEPLTTGVTSALNAEVRLADTAVIIG